MTIKDLLDNEHRCALVMIVNYLLAKGVPFWTPSSDDSYLILILLALLFLRPGHFLGLDA